MKEMVIGNSGIPIFKYRMPKSIVGEKSFHAEKTTWEGAFYQSE